MAAAVGFFTQHKGETKPIAEDGFVGDTTVRRWDCCVVPAKPGETLHFFINCTGEDRVESASAVILDIAKKSFEKFEKEAAANAALIDELHRQKEAYDCFTSRQYRCVFRVVE